MGLKPCPISPYLKILKVIIQELDQTSENDGLGAVLSKPRNTNAYKTRNYRGQAEARNDYVTATLSLIPIQAISAQRYLNTSPDQQPFTRGREDLQGTAITSMTPFLSFLP
jgi:hypothetical protein